MKVFRQGTWADGDILTPHELYSDLKAQVAQLNGGLDVENMETATLDNDDLESTTDPWMLWTHVKDSASNTLTRTGNGKDQAHKLQAGAGYLESTGTWAEGVVNVMAQATVYSTAAGGASSLYTWTLVVLVDGHMVAESGCSSASKISGRMVVCAVPIAAGSHHIEAMIRFSETDPDVVVQNCQLFAYQMVV